MKILEKFHIPTDNVNDDEVSHKDTNEWIIEEERHPLPPFGLDSPVIQYLLASWSKDPQKLQFLLLADVIFVLILLSIIIRQVLLVLIYRKKNFNELLNDT